MRGKRSFKPFAPRPARRKEEPETPKNVPYFSLFRYSTPFAKTLLVAGVLFSVLSAFGLPVVIVLYGEFTTLLVDRNMRKETLSPAYAITWCGGGRTEVNDTEEDLSAAIMEDAVAFGIGCAACAAYQFAFSFLAVFLLNRASVEQGSRLRRIFLRAVLRQDMAWFDVNNANNFASKITEDLDRIQDGTGDKIGVFTYFLLTFLASILLAFMQGWKLTLVIMVCSPIIIVSNGVINNVQGSLTARELESYGKAGSVAEEVISSIKTVMSFGGEAKELERYARELKSSRLAGIRRGLLSGVGGAVMWFIVYCCHSLAFWYGVSLILESRAADNLEYTPSVLTIVFFGVLAGAMNMGQATPHLESFSAAKTAAASVYSIVERVPGIDALSPQGKILADVRGKLRLRNVSFRYPSRPDVEVLKGIDLEINEGETVAVVGSSGSGKSTVVQLVQRMYDPSEGSVLLDDHDARDLNVSWMRRQFGVVGQEPSLFATTIYENIRLGLETATREDVENAAKMANAHDFITRLPLKYDTVLGQKGTQLSGGQKQRIAIARAIVRNPRILVLDEATSALDAASERAVQSALDRASEGRTTVVVTHKLRSVARADKIVVLSEGRIVEEGTHDELVALGEHYFRLLSMQRKTETGAKEASEENLPRSRRGSSTAGISITGHHANLPERPDQDKEEDDDEVVVPASFSRIINVNKPEWLYLVVGSVATLIVGGSLPVVAITFGELYGILSDVDPDRVRDSTAFYSGVFFAVGVVTGLATFAQLFAFGYAGAQLTWRLRVATFSAILRQDATWFDDARHRSGALCARLSGDASSIQGATGSRITAVLQSLSTLFIGGVLSLFFSWKMTLVTLVTVPLVFFGIFLECKIIQGQTLLEKSAMERATGIAVEAISNVRTVASLGREQTILDMYDKELETSEKSMHVKCLMRAFAFALGQTAPFACYGLSLWYGGSLVAYEGLHYKNVIKVSEALLYGAWILGQSLAYAPNFADAKISAGRIFGILDRDPGRRKGITEWTADGRVALSQVKFAYPTRPEVEVLRGLDLDVPTGASIAVVGPSGCGKSTIVQLLQRLYEPSSGSVRVDGRDVSDVDASVLRRRFGTVSQEPVLFDRTIAENIAYGDNSRVVSHDEIVAAAKSANIHEFISCLPLGYETGLGVGGAQLSGGQKQRIAIARALIRNPRILLLDEATSALDAASESAVQSALEAASAGRTTITVSHGLDAVLRAESIYFVDHGRIVESGTHDELLRAGGRYAAMITK